MASRKSQLTPEERDLWGAESTTTTTTTPAEPTGPTASPLAGQFDMEGLMTDFPTAKELEKFVYDETGIVLNLKGRANRVKYQVALDVLNGQQPDPQFVGGDNPYIDRNDLVPVDPILPPPPSDPLIPDRSLLQNSFSSRQVPHPDSDLRAQGRKCDVTFRKYSTGLITYEIMGPVDQRAEGEKIDKYGRTRPEVIRIIDPRSGEQVIQFENGQVTPMGRRLRAMMQGHKINRSNFWSVWIDRDFTSLENDVLSNPWAVE